MTEFKSPFSVERAQVDHAAETLQKLNCKWLEEAKKKPLLATDAEDTTVVLMVSLKKIPKLFNIKMIKIPLPHTLVTNTTEICLFTGDLDKRDRKAEIEPTVLHYKELLQKHKVKGISEIVPLRQLRTDYKSYEAKRKLVAGYDVFLADDRIAQCLPRCLGKFFFKKRKYPQQIRLRKSNLHEEIRKVLSKTTMFLIGKGSSCVVEVAHLNWPKEKIVENVIAAVDCLVKELPGSFPNIQGLYLKTYKSEALPLYMSFESGNNVDLPKIKPPEQLRVEHKFESESDGEDSVEEEEEVGGYDEIDVQRDVQNDDDDERESGPEKENPEAEEISMQGMMEDFVDAEISRTTSKRKPISKKLDNQNTKVVGTSKRDRKRKLIEEKQSEMPQKDHKNLVLAKQKKNKITEISKKTRKIK